MKLFSYALVLLLPLMCSSPKDENNNYDEGEINAEVVLKESGSFNGLVTVPAEVQPQKIIKTSYLKFETKDLEKSYQQIISVVKANKGFIQDDNSNKAFNRITRRITVRVPTTNFQTAIDSIGKHVAYFESKQISAKDVTEEFIDLEARLNAKRTLEKRYLELLNKAKTVKEILEIERELSNIREEIEAKQGRLKYLENKVSLSTIDIEFYKLTSGAPVATSYGTKMWNALKGGFNGISVFFLGILYIWPLILIVLVGVFLLRRWMKKSKK